MSAESRPARIVSCPGCRGPSVFAPANPYRPFCCARCKGHDFGAWASESFRVEVPPSPEDLDPDEPPAAPR